PRAKYARFSGTSVPGDFGGLKIDYEARPQSDGTCRKAPGNNSSTENSLMVCIARLSATQTVAPDAYSASNWRQAPQGIGPPSARATIATATKCFLPLVNALNNATRSAQQVKPKLALSTFAPVIISPDLVSKAAPTLNFE